MPASSTEDVVITGLGALEAPHRVRSAEIDDQLAPVMERLGLKAGVLEHAAGIRERRFWDVGERLDRVAAEAGERALVDAGLDARKVGLLVNTSVNRHYLEPAVACAVHHRLGLAPSCVNFDITNACLGFLDGIEVATAFIASGRAEHALVVNAETAREIVETTVERLRSPGCDERTFRLEFATLTMGSGAAAAVLSRGRGGRPGHRLLGALRRALTSEHRLCRGNASQLRTDTEALFAAGTQLVRDLYADAAAHGWSAAGRKLVIAHQAGRPHIDMLARIVGARPEQVPRTYPEFGNMGPVSIPFTLARVAGDLAVGDRVSLVGFASGLNAAFMDLVW